jgi:hypothetical protein
MSLNLDKLPDKKFYTIDEVCSRWKCNTELIFHYVRIPVQACHRFRSKPATHSIRKLPPIPVKAATPIRVCK